MNNSIFETINNSQNIVILAHQKPDGDAVGSSLAMYHVLKNMNKTVDIILEDVPNTFKFLKLIDEVKQNTDKSYDLGIVLDCSKKERIGVSEEILNNCKRSISIDHHKSNTNYCDINYVEENTSSCAQVLYYLFKEMNISVDAPICEALLLGVLTDTNGYSNDNVDAKTMQMVKEIMELGIDHYRIYHEVLCKQTKAQMALNNIARERLVFYAGGKIAYTYITSDDMKKVGAAAGDHEGLVEIGRNIEGVEVSLFIREEDGYRYSLRSNGNVNVCEIAELFNGGGHKVAAGGIITANSEETKDALINEIKKRVMEI